MNLFTFCCTSKTYQKPVLVSCASRLCPNYALVLKSVNLQSELATLTNATLTDTFPLPDFE